MGRRPGSRLRLWSLAALAAVVLIGAVGGAKAHGEGLIRPALSYAIDKSESDGSTTTTTRRLIDLTLGYMTGDGWTLLGLYGNQNTNYDSEGSVTITERTGYGVGGGYYSKSGPYIDAVYYLIAKEEGGGNKYEGDGYQVDLGYKFDVGSVGLGLQLAYRSFNFKKLNGSTLSPTRKQTNLDPMFALLFTF